MATLVFDIETSALPADSLDEDQQAYLFRELDSMEDPVEREKRRSRLCDMMALASDFPVRLHRHGQCGFQKRPGALPGR